MWQPNLNIQIVYFTNRISFLTFSAECKPVVEDKLFDLATSLLSAYDSGELLEALKAGPTGWQKWVKQFGKQLKRKVGKFGERLFQISVFLSVSCLSAPLLHDKICHTF